MQDVCLFDTSRIYLIYAHLFLRLNGLKSAHQLPLVMLLEYLLKSSLLLLVKQVSCHRTIGLDSQIKRGLFPYPAQGRRKKCLRTAPPAYNCLKVCFFMLVMFSSSMKKGLKRKTGSGLQDAFTGKYLPKGGKYFHIRRLRTQIRFFCKQGIIH